MGPTWCLCPPEAPPNAEIWGTNTMYRNTKIDRMFIMHDIKYDLLLQDKNILENVNKQGFPIYTAGKHPEFINNVEYPLMDIMNEFKILFFLNVIAYMIAFAVTAKPKKLSLYGVDMRTDAGGEYKKNEKGCVEFWLGVSVGRGIHWSAPGESFLCKRAVVSNFYGFKKRALPDGITQIIPSDTKQIFNRYKIIPITPTGEEIPQHTVIMEIDKNLHSEASDGTIK